MGGMIRALGFLLCLTLNAETVSLPGLRQPVEILRDRWGVPHIYAQTVEDLFFAQGYMAARDRLFQIDLWRRVGTGRLAEIAGPAALARDTLARAVRFRGNIDAEWQSYGPDTRRITTSFTEGINAYIKSLKGSRPKEFAIVGYDPELWVPEDCLSRIAGLLMTRNMKNEIKRAIDTNIAGVKAVAKYNPPDPWIRLDVPRGLDLNDITPNIAKVYDEAIAAVRFQGEHGSNNWVVDGTLTTTGKPLLANDPHRPVLIPSLRKAVHLVGPGWNAFGSGEPSLPGIALGHNEHVAFGFTIVGIDQQDLYVERLDPANPNRYLYRGQWKDVEIERQQVKVKGQAQPVTVELRHTLHGPIIHEDRARHRAYALRWVGMEPGTAGYLAGLSLAQARNWLEFTRAVERYKVPSENLVYADTRGNIGWHASGLTPLRKNWSGLYPVPGHTGEYEWSGFLPIRALPKLFNPPSHWIATANHNILPKGYSVPLSYEWAQPFRYQRVREALAGGRKFTIEDFQKLQQDVTAMPAQRFQDILRRWRGVKSREERRAVELLLRWDARMEANSTAAAIYEVWITALPKRLFHHPLGRAANLGVVLRTLEVRLDSTALHRSLVDALEELTETLGSDWSKWEWGRLHTITFRHPVSRKEFDRGPFARPGDANTVNNTGGSGGKFDQTSGASYRQIIDLANWDNSVMTNVPGESGDPDSPHYSNLIQEWLRGEYHPMVFSRKAVEAATVERLQLVPAR